MDKPKELYTESFTVTAHGGVLLTTTNGRQVRITPRTWQTIADAVLRVNGKTGSEIYQARVIH